MSAKPILGYPTRTAAVVDLKLKGFTSRQIAERLGIEVTTVSALECSARRSVSALGHPVKPRRSGIELSFDLRSELRSAAALRGLSVETLALLILERVAYENLIDAVLDDGKGKRS